MLNKEIFLGSLETSNKNIRKYLCNKSKENSIVNCDYYDITNNIITKRIERNILTGEENIRFDQKTKTFAYFQKNKFNIDSLGKYDRMMCNYFRWQEYSDEIEYGMFQGNDKGEIMFRFTDGVTDVKEFKKWLKEKYISGKPVEVYFSMQYPIIQKQDKIYNLKDLNRMKTENIFFDKLNDNKGLKPQIEIKKRNYISKYKD